jgi:hypothetical protein
MIGWTRKRREERGFLAACTAIFLMMVQSGASTAEASHRASCLSSLGSSRGHDVSNRPPRSGEEGKSREGAGKEQGLSAISVGLRNANSRIQLGGLEASVYVS